MKKAIFSLFIFAIYAPASLAWGERGHDLVTRVAVQQLTAFSDSGAALTEPFKQRDHMLSHLSNVPDLHWRAPYMSAAERALNYPTHYIGIESVYPDLSQISDFDVSYQEFAKRAVAAGIQEPARVGSAPWRVLQLHGLMVAALTSAKTAATRAQMITATNQALLYAGIMSHFVGDLANPHHTTTNHNGQLTGNTGLHAYFESDVVRELPFTLVAQVHRRAGPRLLRRTVLKALPRQQRAATLGNPQELLFALVLNSHFQVDRLTNIDNQYSLLEKSSDPTVAAKRIPPPQAAQAYRKFAVERLAIGASVLAQLWVLAWQQAGQPDLSDFHSYHYHLKPDFITPSYLSRGD